GVGVGWVAAGPDWTWRRGSEPDQARQRQEPDRCPDDEEAGHGHQCQSEPELAHPGLDAEEEEAGGEQHDREHVPIAGGALIASFRRASLRVGGECVRVLLRGDLVLLHGERSPGRVGVLQWVEREPGLERRAELFTEPLLRDCREFVVSRRHGGYPLLESNRVDQLQLAGAGLRLRRLDTKSRRSVVRIPLSTTEATRLVCRPRRD